MVGIDVAIQTQKYWLRYLIKKTKQNTNSSSLLTTNFALFCASCKSCEQNLHDITAVRSENLVLSVSEFWREESGGGQWRGCWNRGNAGPLRRSGGGSGSEMNLADELFKKSKAERSKTAEANSS